MKPLSEVLFIMVFLLVVIALIGLQSYMGVLLQKCVENGPSNMTDAEWYDWVQSEEHLMDGEEDTVLCGNSTGAGWVTFDSLLTFYRTHFHFDLKEIFRPSTVTKLLVLVTAGRLTSFIRDANADLFSICDENYTCLPDIGENPSYGYTSYDNMGLALLTSFQLLTLDFWENTYNMILRASGTWNVIYFILVILLGPFYLLNLLLAVVTMAYSKEHEKQEELREMRKKAKERARNKALRRMKQLERQNVDRQGNEGEDGRGSNLWAATISSTRIGLGVGISSRSDSGTTSPQVTTELIESLVEKPSNFEVTWH